MRHRDSKSGSVIRGRRFGFRLVLPDPSLLRPRRGKDNAPFASALVWRCLAVPVPRWLSILGDAESAELIWFLRVAVMANVYSLDGLLVFGLLFICTCAYFRKVPRLKTWLLSEKRGVWGVFYKAAVIGTRLHAAVAMSCIVMAFYVLFIK
ncbi:protein kish-B [Anolis carolinensis]|uniref:Protein kish-B n=1 Tax=Anolis carolinensis TaxID=28377 RepID=G1KJQ4_ANOCA